MTDEAAIERPKGGRPRKGTDEQFNRLGTEKIGRLLREFAIPAIASLVVNGLYNILSAIFLGWGVGELGLAVSTVANPMMMFFMALGMLVGTGGNALCAIKLGEGRKDEAERVLGNTVTIGIIVYLITLVIIFVAIDPILAISGATEETWEWSKTFLQILGAGSIVQIIGFGLNNFIRSAGDPNRALYTMVAGTLTCLALSFLLGMSMSMMSPSRTSPMLPPAAASGEIWPMLSPEVPPLKRPSVIRAQAFPRCLDLMYEVG